MEKKSRWWPPRWRGNTEKPTPKPDPDFAEKLPHDFSWQNMYKLVVGLDENQIHQDLMRPGIQIAYVNKEVDLSDNPEVSSIANAFTLLAKLPQEKLFVGIQDPMSVQLQFERVNTGPVELKTSLCRHKSDGSTDIVQWSEYMIFPNVDPFGEVFTQSKRYTLDPNINMQLVMSRAVIETYATTLSDLRQEEVPTQLPANVIIFPGTK